jgi:hypothetical protein
VIQEEGNVTVAIIDSEDLSLSNYDRCWFLTIENIGGALQARLMAAMATTPSHCSSAVPGLCCPVSRFPGD